VAIKPKNMIIEVVFLHHPILKMLAETRNVRIFLIPGNKKALNEEVVRKNAKNK
jgi:hypothetical protein